LRIASCNETALFRMSDGSCARINEFRRIGHVGGERFSLYGTKASFEEQCRHQVWVEKNRDQCVDLTELLACGGVPAGNFRDLRSLPASDAVYRDVAKVHPVHRLPKEFVGLGNGHCGSHQFLIHDFITACVSGATPENNVWAAARYLVPGLIAHESARQGGVLLDIPDFGDSPPS